MADGSQWNLNPIYPTGPADANPGGYSGFLNMSVDYRGAHPAFSGIPSLVSDLNSYGIGALSSENNYRREADMKAMRADFSFDFESDGFLRSLDAGLRFGSRDAENFQFHLLAPFYENGCLVRWKATDVVMSADSCSAGNGTDFYTAGMPTPLASFGSNVIQIRDFGGVSGIPSSGFYVLNPAAMDNPRAFQDSLYPGNVDAIIPGQSYTVGLEELSYYLQANFGGTLGVPYSGNFGVRVVDTSLNVVQNTVGVSQPYGAPQVDTGDLVTSRDFTDVLPSLNLAFDLTDEMILRFAYAKTMAPLDLAQWGGGLSANYAINSETGIFEVISASASGNPELDPWRADNFDLSYEWYFSDASMAGIGLFYIDVESFIESGIVPMAIPDQDGVVRRITGVSTNVQGKGGVLKGVELSWKQSFHTFTDSFWGNFGFDTNYTYAPSESGNVDANGDELPFQDNSEHQANFALWYQAENWQGRVGYNYRSERAVQTDVLSNWGAEGLTLYQQPTHFVDASVSWDINDTFQVYLQGMNLTNEYEDYYIQWESQHAYQNIYERRFVLGVRVHL
jgi:TonB-dependent receptor